jgi:cation diffusion facilitator family transporter
LKPTQAAALSVVSNTTLVLLKLFAGVITGSVSIISEAIHSGLDLLAAIIALYSVTQSGKPPDQDHSYGHGKIENISAFVEALLIFVAAIWIIVEAYKKIIHGVHVESLFVGLIIMGISAVANYFISVMLFNVGKKYDSLALLADGLHLRTDVYTSVGVFVGLAVISLTGIKILDPIVAIAVALLIIYASWELTRKSFTPLLDVRLSKEDEAEVLQIIENFRSDYIEFHKLRTRKAGPERHIDLHLIVRPDRPVAEAHALVDRIEKALKERWNRTSVLIHVEPCVQQACDDCPTQCLETAEAAGGEPVA